MPNDEEDLKQQIADLQDVVMELTKQVAEKREEVAALAEQLQDARYALQRTSEKLVELTPVDPNAKVTLSGKPPTQEGGGAPRPVNPATGQHEDYWVLSEAERKKGFVRPVRQSYRHLKCGTSTTMALSIAETYARSPSFYGNTFCCACRDHFPVGEDGEFVWPDGSKVGT